MNRRKIKKTFYLSNLANLSSSDKCKLMKAVLLGFYEIVDDSSIKKAV